MVRNGDCGEVDGETGLEVEVLGGVLGAVGACSCWKDTCLEDFRSGSSVGLPSWVPDALVREGLAGRGVMAGRGLYFSEGGTFSWGGGPARFERYSDMGIFAGLVPVCLSMELSLRTSVSIGSPSVSL